MSLLEYFKKKTKNLSVHTADELAGLKSMVTHMGTAQTDLENDIAQTQKALEKSVDAVKNLQDRLKEYKTKRQSLENRIPELKHAGANSAMLNAVLDEITIIENQETIFEKYLTTADKKRNEIQVTLTRLQLQLDELKVRKHLLDDRSVIAASEDGVTLDDYMTAEDETGMSLEQEMKAFEDECRRTQQLAKLAVKEEENARQKAQEEMDKRNQAIDKLFSDMGGPTKPEKKHELKAERVIPDKRNDIDNFFDNQVKSDKLMDDFFKSN